MKDYHTWAYLNEEGMKELGDIFPEKTIPIVSLIQIKFTHPTLNTPETAYILRGRDLTETELEKLIDKTAKKFNDESKKDEIKDYILKDQIPIRTCLISGAGTKNIHLYLSDFDGGDDYDDWGDEGEDWDPEEDEDWL